jgi:glycosyltransferase involved in cell wall biosynthesis
MHVMRVTGMAGAERQLADLLAAPEWDGIELEARLLVGGEFDFSEFARLEDLGRPVRTIPMQRDLSRSVVGALRGDFRRCDIVHTHLVHADWHALAASPSRRAKWISTKHNQDRFRVLPPVRAIEAQVDRRADKTIAISQALADFTHETTGVAPDVIRYGFSRRPIAARPVRESGPYSLLGLGRLVEQKGFDTAIRALPVVLREHPGTVLTLAGDGPDRGRLETLARELGVAGQVRFQGWVEDPGELLRTHDLLVHPARWEGFGLVLLEAMAARLPIVGSQAGALPEVLDAGRVGRLVPPDAPDALAAELIALLSRPEERSRLADGAAERLVQDFSMSATVGRLTALYQLLV